MDIHYNYHFMVSHTPHGRFIAAPHIRDHALPAPGACRSTQPFASCFPTSPQVKKHKIKQGNREFSMEKCFFFMGFGAS